MTNPFKRPKPEYIPVPTPTDIPDGPENPAITTTAPQGIKPSRRPRQSFLGMAAVPPPPSRGGDSGGSFGKSLLGQ